MSGNSCQIAIHKIELYLMPLRPIFSGRYAIDIGGVVRCRCRARDLHIAISDSCRIGVEINKGACVCGVNLYGAIACASIAISVPSAKSNLNLAYVVMR